MAKQTECPVAAYARAVVAGEIVAGRLVRLACERHLADLADSAARGLRFDAEAAQRAVGFFSFLRLPSAGELDGKPFTLEPFQQFIVGSLFGWKGADGFRRFRTAYIEIGKGNGKTPLAAGIAIYGLVADGEAAAEIYSAATTREQAGILFRDARRMVEASPALRDRLEIGQHNIAYPRGDSFLRPLSSEHRGLDGKRPHIALVDEVHEHPTPLVVDKMRAGTKGRRQALIVEITNSGYDRTSVCWQHHDFSAKLLEGLAVNDSWFAYVCTLDPCAPCRDKGQRQPVDGCKACDDWRDEKAWPKANPGIETILPAKYLREQVAEALDIPTKENIVKRLNFCVWTEVVTRAIPLDKWDSCAGTVNADGQECFAGLDIGATSDFTALVLLFPHDDAETVAAEKAGAALRVRRSYSLLPFFWLPENPVRRDAATAKTIDDWRRQGFIRTTPGDVVDYDQVLRDVIELSQRYPVRELAFDRGFQGVHLGTRLLAHFGEQVVVSFPQGLLSMAPPFREFLELVSLGRLLHDGNPVMRWMAGNCAAEERGGLAKPSKDRSTEKIDGITATVMAMGRAMLKTTEQGGGYESW